MTAGTTYVASYFAPKGHYSVNSAGLSSAVDNGALHTIPNATSGNGVYAYSAASTFPNNSYNATNYWVDVMYAFPVPGQVTNVVADSGGATSANVNWNAPAGGGPVTSYKITPYLGSVAQAATTITGNPPATSKQVNGLTTGSTLHVHRAGDQRQRRGRGVGAVQRGDARGGRGAGCPDRRARAGRRPSRRSSAGRCRAPTVTARSPATPSRPTSAGRHRPR